MPMTCAWPEGFSTAAPAVLKAGIITPVVPAHLLPAARPALLPPLPFRLFPFHFSAAPGGPRAERVHAARRDRERSGTDTYG